jgi:uncharacterized protein (DUF736 family)
MQCVKGKNMDYQIGWVAEQVDGRFKCSIRTLTIHEQITHPPRAGQPAPGRASQYDVLIGSGASMGHAKLNDNSTSIPLHSPELAALIIANLAAAKAPGEWLLLWQHAGRRHLRRCA